VAYRFDRRYPSLLTVFASAIAAAVTIAAGAIWVITFLFVGWITSTQNDC